MATGGQNFIGPYRLLKLVRAGHACQIWEAMNSTDNQRVALKALQKEHREDRQEIAFLKNEYTVGKELKHRCIVSIYEYNVDHGIPYVVLEYFHSLNLKQALRQNRDDVIEHVSKIIRGAAEGLAHLHGKGWVHRDVKPDNFLVDVQEGKVKLIDFAIAQRVKTGLAKLLGGRGKIQGTRSYMSPEQIRGKVLDCRSDIYSFGCTLYEIVGGKLAYTGTSADDLLNKHLRGSVPSLQAANNQVTKDFSDLVARMMAKKADNRPESMEEFLNEYSKMRIFKIRRVAAD